MTRPPRRAFITAAVAGAAVLAVFSSQFAWVSATNFGGYDEWLILNLNADGVLSIPNANRPLGFLWHLPARWIVEHGFAGYWWLHAAYLALTGVAVLWIALRVAPGCLWAAFLSGTFAAIWAPSDLARLSTVQMIINSGSTFATFLAVALLVESWRRGSRPLLAAGLAVATLAALSYEACLGVIVAAPILLLLLPGKAKLRVWIGAWEVVAVALVARVVASAFSGSGAGYQAAVIGLDPAPHRLAVRLAGQFSHHLLPLSGTRVLIGNEAALSGLAFLAASLGLFLVARRTAAQAEPSGRRCLALAGVGLLLAAAAYAPFALGRLIQAANRTEFLAAPGIGLLLGFAAQALVSGIRPAWRTPLLVVAGTWVTLIGTAHMVQMQRAWRHLSYYPAQVSTLRQIVQLVPGVRPGRLLLLVDTAPRPAWPASFGFRHAITYLYEGSAVGHLFGAVTVFHPIRFEQDAIHVGADPAVETPWRCPATRHPYEGTVVLRRGPDGTVRVCEDWPPSLPALPSGASYRPTENLVPGTAHPQWKALDVPAEH